MPHSAALCAHACQQQEDHFPRALFVPRASVNPCVRRLPDCPFSSRVSRRLSLVLRKPGDELPLPGSCRSLATPWLQPRHGCVVGPCLSPGQSVPSGPGAVWTWQALRRDSSS